MSQNKQNSSVIGIIDVSTLPQRAYRALDRLFNTSQDVEYLSNPHTGAVVFSSDKEYFLDDAHGGKAINPFIDFVANGSSIVDGFGNQVLSYREYLAMFNSLEYSVGPDIVRKQLLAMVIEEQLNCIQQYREGLDPEYLISTADDLAIATLNGTLDAYLQEMADNGCRVNENVPQRFGTPLHSAMGSAFAMAGPNSRAVISAAQLIARINNSKKNAGVDTSLSPMLAASTNLQTTSLKEVLSTTWSDEGATIETRHINQELDAEGKPIEYSDPVDVSGLPGVIIPSTDRQQYQHRVSVYRKTSDQIFKEYAWGGEARHCLEEIHLNAINAVRSVAPVIRSIEDRAMDESYGWDVYRVRYLATKNQLSIEYVHDLRLHEWSEKLSHKYRK